MQNLEAIKFSPNKLIAKDLRSYKYCYFIKKGIVRLNYTIHSNFNVDYRRGHLITDYDQEMCRPLQYVKFKSALKKIKDREFVVDLTDDTDREDFEVGSLGKNDFILEENLVFDKKM